MGLIREAGPEVFGWYVGNGTASDHLGGWALSALSQGLGSSRSYSAASIDIAPSYKLAEIVTGTYLLLPRWRWNDPSVKVVLWFGGNPAVSHGYQTLMPDPVRRIRSFRNRGGRFWVIDPRLTRTGSNADRQLQIRPGRDLRPSRLPRKVDLGPRRSLGGIHAFDNGDAAGGAERAS